MKKKSIFAVVLIAISAFTICGCGATKTLHCDKCGKEISVSANSNMDEDWIIFCEECGDPALELFEEK